MFQDLYNQLPKPCFIEWDFNAYNEIWGSRTTDQRGYIIESFLQINSLNILNDGRPTRIEEYGETAIHSTIYSARIQHEFDWNVWSYPSCSNNCIIIIQLPDKINPTLTSWN